MTPLGGGGGGSRYECSRQCPTYVRTQESGSREGREDHHAQRTSVTAGTHSTPSTPNLLGSQLRLLSPHLTLLSPPVICYLRYIITAFI